MSQQNDRKLLELAAKAAGIEGNYEPKYFCGAGPNDHGIYVEETGWLWNPIDDSGDAMRLAVRLGFIVDTHGVYTRISFPFGDVICIEAHGNDPYAATRRAIVRAAAETVKAIGDES